MITEDQVVAMFAKANPVPSLDLLDPVEPLDPGHLEHRSERSSEMTELKTEPKATGRRNPFLIPVLAVGVIALVAVGILLTRDGGVASPESVANAYMEAREQLDSEAALALFASDATVSEEGFDLSQMPGLFAWYQGVGWSSTSGECVADTETLVKCGSVFENDWTRALGMAPIGAEVTIVVKDGEITNLVTEFEPGFGEAWDAFFTWVDGKYPEDFDLMFGSQGPRVDPESIALWTEHTDEFVAETGG